MYSDTIALLEYFCTKTTLMKTKQGTKTFKTLVFHNIWYEIKHNKNALQILKCSMWLFCACILSIHKSVQLTISKSFCYLVLFGIFRCCQFFRWFEAFFHSDVHLMTGGCEPLRHHQWTVLVEM